MDYDPNNGHIYNNKLYQKLLKETREYNKNTSLARVSNINYNL